MAAEFFCLLGGAFILLVPGVWLAGALSLGNNLFERWANGCSLGLAMAVYLSALISQVDLRAFYPLWATVSLICLAMRFRARKPATVAGESSALIFMILILFAVAVLRFAMALPLQLPPGTFDPTFHLILARQIQLTHHAIDRWPFANIPLNYPTGSHTLIVVLAGLTHLPLHTVFKDLIPLLGVISTAQMYVFARRMIGAAMPAVYAAAVYGLWAWFGSNDYFRWGGLPNELAMLLFIALLSVEPAARGRTFAMTVCYAAILLVHHHVMVVASLILALIIVWELLHRRRWRFLALPLCAGLILDSFFLVPYAMHLGNFKSTGMAIAGEPLLLLADLPASFGHALVITALIGIVLCLVRKARCNPVLGIGAAALAAMFVVGEDIVPMVLNAMHRISFTFFTPSRFLTDLNYFLPVFAGQALFCAQRNLRVPQPIVMVFILLAPLGDWQRWNEMFNLGSRALPSQLLTACDWIQHNTPPDTLVDNTGPWMTYLCWREPVEIPIPVSEPLGDYQPAGQRIALILAGRLPSRLTIVRITDARSADPSQILWQGRSGIAVIREWPR